MMYEREATDFQELWAYLQEKRRKATEDTFPARAAQLLEEVKADPELFARRLGFHQSDDLTYYRIPILAWIDPNEFVSTVLGMSPEHQRTIMRVFKDRYGGGLLLNELNKERPWLQAVSDKMTKAADSLSPIARHIVTRNLKQYVTPFIRN